LANTKHFQKQQGSLYFFIFWKIFPKLFFWRGVRLSSADLLKNYLFSTIDISQEMPDKFIDKLDEQWEKIGVNIFGKTIND
jgi:hypothetical protein